MLNEEAFRTQNHLCSTEVSVCALFCLCPDGNGAFVTFQKVGFFFFFFNANSSLLLTSQKKKEREKGTKKYIHISLVMIDKIVTTQALLKHLGVFCLFFVLYFFLPLSLQSE